MDNKNKKERKRNHRVVTRRVVEEIANTLHENASEPFPSDVQGSWTGTPLDDSEEPVQDADDL